MVVEVRIGEEKRLCVDECWLEIEVELAVGVSNGGEQRGLYTFASLTISLSVV